MSSAAVTVLDYPRPVQTRSLNDAPPPHWPEQAQTALRIAVSLAAAAAATLHGKLAFNSRREARLVADNQRLAADNAQLREELAIKDGRTGRLEPRKRPHYSPVERHRILMLQAVRGWTFVKTARRFQVTPATIAAWAQRLDEGGKAAFVKSPEPVNRFPDFVRALVKQLLLTAPLLGRRKVAEHLARAGLDLAASTVRRIRDERLPQPPQLEEPTVGTKAREKRIRAKAPLDVLHLDLTAVPTAAGFWMAFLPWALPQCWPFCWWVAAVLDNHSRKALAVKAYARLPTTVDMVGLLTTVTASYGHAKALITDQGVQFTAKALRKWCNGSGVGLRFGAVGKHGSIAIVERFIRTLKYEHIFEQPVPLNAVAVQASLDAFSDYYNAYRPHSALKGDTPNERYFGLAPSRASPRWEPRPKYPRDVPLRALKGTRLELNATAHEGYKQLPVVELRAA